MLCSLALTIVAPALGPSLFQFTSAESVNDLELSLWTVNSAALGCICVVYFVPLSACGFV